VSETVDPRTTARHYLGAELRRLREMAGVNGRQMAERIGLSQTKVSRIETGRGVPTMPEVMAWAAVVEASDETREHLRRLTEAAYTDVTPYRDALAALPHLQDAVRAVEATARSIRNYQPEIVPGLLQTAEYARHVFRLVDPHGEMDQAAATAGRMRRQDALYDSAKHFDFLIHESALRWRPVSRPLLAAQLDRIGSVSTLENVTIGVIPADVDAPAALYHGFVIYDDRDDEHDPIVNVELVHGEATIADADDVKLYLEHWEAWAKVALHDDAARAFLARLASELRGLTDESKPGPPIG
jgi:transcriptional regulator with XRE-family HTH domain